MNSLRPAILRVHPLRPSRGVSRRLALFLPVALVALSLLTVPAAMAVARPPSPPVANQPAADPVNLVDNGSFEQPDIASSTFEPYPAGSGSIPGWEIRTGPLGGGSVDIVTAPYWLTADGNQVLDLDGDPAAGPDFGGPFPGSIAQSIPVEAGVDYELTFRFAANPDCGDQGDKAMDVHWDGEPVGETVTHPSAGPSLPGPSSYDTFQATVVGGVEGSELAFISRDVAGSTCGIVIDDVSVTEIAPAPPTPWVGDGTGTPTVVSDGMSAPPQFQYSHVPGGVSGASGTWHFSTTATTAQTVQLDWAYTGFHAYFQVRAGLKAFVISAESADTDITLVNDGPVDCCTPPSGGFSYSGTTALAVEPGDVYGFTMTGSNFDINTTLSGTLTINASEPPPPPPAPAPELIRAVSTGGTGAFLIGRLDGVATTAITVAASTAASCIAGVLGSPATLAPVTTTTDANGYFGVQLSGVQPGDYLSARISAPTDTAESACIVSSGDNDFWPKALGLDGSGLTAHDVIDAQGKARWYRFSVTPGQLITIRLTGLPADYDLAVFKDIGKEFLSQLTPTDAADLTKLSAEYAPSVFSPSVFSPSVFSPSVFSPDAYSPSVFSPSVFSPSVFSPSVFSPSVFSPSVFSPSVFSPSVFSPSVFSPSVFSPSVFSPSVFSPSVFSADDVAKAFSSAQTRTIIGVSATTGTGDETVVVNSWNNKGEFYVRVAGHAGAFDTGLPFTVSVTRGATDCGLVTDTAVPSVRAPKAGAGIKTVILTDSSRLALGTTGPNTLRTRLTTFAGRTEVGGVIVDVATDARVTALKAQAAANRGCPFATNLVADEIKSIVDSYRLNNPGLRYVTLVGGDTVIPFFRYPDQSLLGQESGYVPPVKSDSISEASLRKDFVLSQDAYGSGTSVSLRTSDFPVPGLAVGRLVETPAEILGMLDAYIATNGVVVPGSSLVTGYDFLEDAAAAVRSELESGTATPADTLITPNGKSPQDPASWTAAQLASKLLGSRHDVVFLAGHFSANSALAADFQTSLLTTDLAASSVNLRNAIIFSAGCHSGYNLLDDEALPGVALPLDWSQAFAQKGATLVAGTGYQYGDTDFLEYSERLYRDFARELRAGSGAVSIGEALTRAKLAYLATTPDIRGIHEKALLEATLFGLPMLGVNMPAGRGAASGTGPALDPAEAPAVNGTDLKLATYDLSLSPTLTGHALDLKNPPYDAIPGTFTQATWLSGETGVVTNPAEPALPLHAVNVSSTNPAQVLRGVGFRGGTYVDSGPMVPLTGAPTTELRGVHAPFISPVFYPMKLWNPNYYGALGGSGGTNLLVTPVQHKADPSGLGKSIQRKYTDLDLRLFYSNNLTTASLSDAPSIVGVDAQRAGSTVTFTVQVVGDPKAFIHGVWITYTGGTGTWAPLDLTRSTIDTSLWTGTLSSAPANVQFVVQAANGLGLVAFDDNRGTYYQTNGAPGATVAATTLTLVSPPTAGIFGDAPTIVAELKSGATALADKTVAIAIGGSGAVGTTGADGRVSLDIPLNALPGSAAISASFGGDADHGPSDTSAPFSIGKATSSLSAFSAQRAVVTAGGATGMVSRLTASVGGTAQGLAFESVTFTLTGAQAKTYSTITDFLGNATLPSTGLKDGTYTVKVTFPGNRTYTSATRTGSLLVSKFNGFLSPLVNPPKLNTAVAGLPVLVRFGLGGNRGLDIVAPDSPTATRVDCTTGAPIGAPVSAETYRVLDLVYVPLLKQYLYVWKVPTSYRNGCYLFTLTLVDGSAHTANFRFK